MSGFEKNKVLAPFCTYQIGGPADWFLEATNPQDLLEGIGEAKKKGLPFFVFGGGSNLLFDDAGFRGLVIHVAMNDLNVNGEEIRAGAGCKISTLVNAAKESGLSGLEAWNGLPGTVGGAVFGNAGCFGVETKDILKSAEIYDSEVKIVGKDFFEFEYRNSKIKKGGGVVVLSATFKLQKGDRAAIEVKMKEVAAARAKKQAAGSSTGSFFKNPSPEQPAGMLIEQCGLKGKMVGRAQISPVHANFILNKGGATAADVLGLADLAQKEVENKFGVVLEREVVYISKNIP